MKWKPAIRFISFPRYSLIELFLISLIANAMVDKSIWWFFAVVPAAWIASALDKAGARDA